MEAKTYMRPGAGRARRRRFAILQADLAKRLGVAPCTYSNWETSRYPVPWHWRDRVAEALGGKRGLFEERGGAER